jgi:hypothetical protein
MDLAALESAVNTFAAAPKRPKLELAPSPTAHAAGMGAQMETLVRSYVEGIHEWRLEVHRRQCELWTACETLKGLPPEALKETLPLLDDLIDFVDRNISLKRAFLDQAEKQAKRVSALLRQARPNDARAPKLRLKKVMQAAVLEHNTRVEFYDFLLALRSEFDPAARGGPVFENPEDLEAYLDRAAG